ncbi:hypothetical protein MPSEU_000500800 [Mayamaea pseudoterrestris]|nr:hypothetical protein MPSEU_000500800 [Mayamaea pseudoterrestris]
MAIISMVSQQSTIIILSYLVLVQSFMLANPSPATLMGLAASILPKESLTPSKATRNDEDIDAWKNKVKEFQEQLLDDSFLHLPVRGNTIEAASLYKQSSQTNDVAAATLMPGTHKHLGGAYDPTDGTIYGVPANSKAVLFLKYHEPSNSYKMGTIPLPDSVKDYKMKWLRGIFAHGYLWAIPSWAPKVLCVDVDAFWGRRKVTEAGIVQLLDLPSGHSQESGEPMQWQWHGAGLNQEKTAIYCIPSNAKQVLKVDLMTKSTSLIPIQYDKQKYPDFTLQSSNKWYGGIFGVDNCVYGIPYRSCAVLRIDCNNDSASLVGPDYGVAKFNWHGGIQVNGKIYAHPSHANTVLVIDTHTDATDENRCSEMPIRRAEYETGERNQYKWLGGNVGVDGNIYCPACDTSSVLVIDTTKNEAHTFGFAGTDKNKWQGGVLGRDGCVYCIPASGNHVLRIKTGDENAVQLLGNLPSYKDKWQGGHAGLDGSLYFIPENGFRVLKVTPPEGPPELVNGELPDGDVTIEML